MLCVGEVTVVGHSVCVASYSKTMPHIFLKVSVVLYCISFLETNQLAIKLKVIICMTLICTQNVARQPLHLNIEMIFVLSKMRQFCQNLV